MLFRSPARLPARRRCRVQLGSVAAEQLFAAGPLWLPSPKSLRLEVHPAREEADATGTAGELLASPKGRPWAGARGLGAAGCAQPRGRGSPSGAAVSPLPTKAWLGGLPGYRASSPKAHMLPIVS